jgi:transcription elongation GreA/GreB family factor
VEKRDARPAADLLSTESPVGQAMLGRDVGETVSVATPSGIRQFLIERRSP